MTGNANVLIESEHQLQITTQKAAVHTWRMLNTIILLFGFFAPWMKGCSTDITGGDVAKFTGPILVGLIQQPAGLFRADNWVLISFIIFADAILIYAILNASYAIFSKPAKIWRRNTLVSAIGASTVMFAGWVTAKSHESFLWGFWLSCAGILSAISVEILDKPRSDTG